MQEYEYRITENGSIELLRYRCFNQAEVIIPNEVEGRRVVRIGHDCFFDHPEIKSVSFPDSLLSIGENSFALCKGLQELALPDSITDIEPYAFRDCKGIKRVVMPKHLKVLRAGVFAFCHLNDNAEIELPDELEEIETHAFFSGGSFELVVPRSVKRIGIGAFNGGPEAITSLPYDKGWYLDWPYGEEVQFADGQIGKVTDYKELTNHCLALEVTMKNHKREVFYPCVNESDYVFKKTESQKMMVDERNNVSDLKETYQAWHNGLL